MWTQPQHTPLLITAAASGAFLFILLFCRRRRQQALPFAPVSLRITVCTNPPP
ncbi:Prepilin peptidase [Escherichia coli]|nr:Prepilin peptidase [Escherichia coli]